MGFSLPTKPLILALLVTAAPSAIDGQSNPSCKAEFERRLELIPNMSSEEFEAESGDGWRPLANVGCFADAANLLEAYSAKHGAHYARSFHQARQWLSLDEFQKARPHLLASIRHDMPSASRFKWNNYVLAHVAYVDRDQNRFRREMAALESDAEFHPNKVNLKILRKIDTDFGLKFSEIFEIKNH